MNWSRHEYNQALARMHGQKCVSAANGCDDEAELHRAILDECSRRGWIVFHGSMAHRTYRVPGEPDFIILADGGATILVEAKTRTGKMSTDQLGIQAWARKLEHTIHVVRSMDDFRAALNVKEAA